MCACCPAFPSVAGGTTSNYCSTYEKTCFVFLLSFHLSVAVGCDVFWVKRLKMGAEEQQKQEGALVACFFCFMCRPASHCWFNAIRTPVTQLPKPVTFGEIMFCWEPSITSFSCIHDEADLPGVRSGNSCVWFGSTVGLRGGRCSHR